MSKTKIVLVTSGSHGDLNPFIALALRLQQAGLEPVIATMSDYRAKVEAAGLKFHEVRPSMDQVRRDLNVDDQGLARLVMANPAFVFEAATFPYLQVAYDDIVAALSGTALVLTSSLAYSARLAAEKYAVPYVAIVLQPAMLLSAYDPPMHPNAPRLSAFMRRLGPRVNASAARVMKRITARWAAPLTAFRKELGLLPDPRNAVFEGQYSHHATLGLYSSILGDIQPDHPRSTQLTGFLFYDSDPKEDPTTRAALTQFLASGPAPLVFVLGSAAHQNAGDFFEVSVAATKALGRRAVIVTGTPLGQPSEGQAGEGQALEGQPVAGQAQSPGPLAHLEPSPDIFTCPYIAYSKLFPAAAAIIHQGGIGTLAQALRAGKPQLIVPFLGDQLDNASRATRLGAARIVLRSRYRARQVAATLQLLLTDPSYALTAQSLGARIRKEDGAGAAVGAIQRVLATLEKVKLGNPPP